MRKGGFGEKDKGIEDKAAQVCGGRGCLCFLLQSRGLCEFVGICTEKVWVGMS